MGKYPFRRIKNWVAGRPNYNGGNTLDLKGVQRLLDSIDHGGGEEIALSLVYYHPKHKLFETNVHPGEALRWVSGTFMPLEQSSHEPYFEGIHHVYSGKESDKHYLELSGGVIKKEKDKKIKKGRRRAHLEFLVNHRL